MAGYTFGGVSRQTAKISAFQSVAKAEAVLLPERFRGGCSFGDPLKGCSPASSATVLYWR
jgi:hypothetical protein